MAKSVESIARKRKEAAKKEKAKEKPKVWRPPVDANTAYQVLGTTPDADEKMLKKRYHAIAKDWHPDVSKQADADAVFGHVSRAYKMLMNKEERMVYDFFMHEGLALHTDTFLRNYHNFRFQSQMKWAITHRHTVAWAFVGGVFTLVGSWRMRRYWRQAAAVPPQSEKGDAATATDDASAAAAAAAGAGEAGGAAAAREEAAGAGAAGAGAAAVAATAPPAAAAAAAAGAGAAGAGEAAAAPGQPRASTTPALGGLIGGALGSGAFISSGVSGWFGARWALVGALAGALGARSALPLAEARLRLKTLQESGAQTLVAYSRPICELSSAAVACVLLHRAEPAVRIVELHLRSLQAGLAGALVGHGFGHVACRNAEVAEAKAKSR